MNRNEASRLVELMGADWQERPVPPDHHNADKRTELVRKDGLSLSLTFGGGWRTEPSRFSNRNSWWKDCSDRL